MGGFFLTFSLATPPDADLYCCGFFLGSDLMGGFGSGWLFSLLFSLAVPFDADLCVFCCCFCFSMVVVLVSSCGGFGVQLWWF